MIINEPYLRQKIANPGYSPDSHSGDPTPLVTRRHACAPWLAGLRPHRIFAVRRPPTIAPRQGERRRAQTSAHGLDRLSVSFRLLAHGSQPLKDAGEVLEAVIPALLMLSVQRGRELRGACLPRGVAGGVPRRAMPSRVMS